MELKIDKSDIEKAIQDHLNESVKRGIDYRVTDALNKAIADAITPEVVSGFVDSAMAALTDKDLTARILDETHRAIGYAVQMTVQESIVSMVARLRGWKPDGYASREKQEELDALRARLFPSQNAGAVARQPGANSDETNQP